MKLLFFYFLFILFDFIFTSSQIDINTLNLTSWFNASMYRDFVSIKNLESKQNWLMPYLYPKKISKRANLTELSMQIEAKARQLREYQMNQIEKLNYIRIFGEIEQGLNISTTEDYIIADVISLGKVQPAFSAAQSIYTTTDQQELFIISPWEKNSQFYLSIHPALTLNYNLKVEKPYLVGAQIFIDQAQRFFIINTQCFSNKPSTLTITINIIDHDTLLFKMDKVIKMKKLCGNIFYNSFKMGYGIIESRQESMSQIVFEGKISTVFSGTENKYDIVDITSKSLDFYCSYYPDWMEYAKFIKYPIKQLQQSSQFKQFQVASFTNIYLYIEKPELVDLVLLKNDKPFKIQQFDYQGNIIKKGQMRMKLKKKNDSLIQKTSSQIKFKKVPPYFISFIQESISEQQYVNPQIDVNNEIPIDPTIYNFENTPPPTNSLKLDAFGNPISELESIKNGLYQQMTSLLLSIKSAEEKIITLQSKNITSESGIYETERLKTSSQRNQHMKQLLLKQLQNYEQISEEVEFQEKKQNLIKSLFKVAISREDSTTTELLTLEAFSKVIVLDDAKQQVVINKNQTENIQTYPFTTTNADDKISDLETSILNYQKTWDKKNFKFNDYEIDNRFDKFSFDFECHDKGESKFKIVMTPDFIYNPFEPITIEWTKKCQGTIDITGFTLSSEPGLRDVFDGKNVTKAFDINLPKFSISNLIFDKTFYLSIFGSEMYYLEVHPPMVENMSPDIIDIISFTYPLMNQKFFILYPKPDQQINVRVRCKLFGQAKIKITVRFSKDFFPITFSFLKNCGTDNLKMNMYTYNPLFDLQGNRRAFQSIPEGDIVKDGKLNQPFLDWTRSNLTFDKLDNITLYFASLAFDNTIDFKLLTTIKYVHHDEETGLRYTNSSSFEGNTSYTPHSFWYSQGQLQTFFIQMECLWPGKIEMDFNFRVERTYQEFDFTIQKICYSYAVDYVLVILVFFIIICLLLTFSVIIQISLLFQSFKQKQEDQEKQEKENQLKKKQELELLSKPSKSQFELLKQITQQQNKNVKEKVIQRKKDGIKQQLQSVLDNFIKNDNIEQKQLIKQEEKQNRKQARAVKRALQNQQQHN